MQTKFILRFQIWNEKSGIYLSERAEIMIETNYETSQYS